MFARACVVSAKASFSVYCSVVLEATVHCANMDFAYEEMGSGRYWSCHRYGRDIDISLFCCEVEPWVVDVVLFHPAGFFSFSKLYYSCLE